MVTSVMQRAIAAPAIPKAGINTTLLTTSRIIADAMIPSVHDSVQTVKHAGEYERAKVRATTQACIGSAAEHLPFSFSLFMASRESRENCFVKCAGEETELGNEAVRRFVDANDCHGGIVPDSGREVFGHEYCIELAKNPHDQTPRAEWNCLPQRLVI